MKGRGLLMVTAKTLVVSWMLRITAWIIAGSPFALHGGPHWLVIPSDVMSWMVVGNMLVIATWNLAANLRAADQVITDACAEIDEQRLRARQWADSAWEHRPGGVHISTGPHLKYVAPHLSGGGTISVAGVQVQPHFHQFPRYDDRGEFLYVGNEMCCDQDCIRPRAEH